MSAPYVTRRAINATESFAAQEKSLIDPVISLESYWDAELDGYLSTGEHVHMSRGGETFAAAVAALEAAIAENGWTIREKGTR